MDDGLPLSLWNCSNCSANTSHRCWVGGVVASIGNIAWTSA